MRQQHKLIVRVNEDEQSIFRCIDLLKLLEEQVRSHQSSFNPEKIQFLIKFFSGKLSPYHCDYGKAVVISFNLSPSTIGYTTVVNYFNTPRNEDIPKYNIVHDFREILGDLHLLDSDSIEHVIYQIAKELKK